MTTQLQIVQNDFPLDSQFVSSVSLQDDWMVFGSWLNSTDDDELNPVTGAGSIFIRERSGASWGNEIKVASPWRGTNVYFGLKVDTGGDWIVTAIYPVTRFYIIRKSTQAITVINTSIGNMGWDIVCDDDCSTIVVSAPFLQGDGIEGIIRVYSWDGSVATVVANNISAGGAVVDRRFGYNIAISGDGTVIAIGSLEPDSKGKVWIARKGAGWSSSTLTEVVTADTEAANNYFGAAPGQFGAQATVFSGSPLALNTDGTILIVGAYGDDSGGSGFGAVYLFTDSGGFTKTLRIDGTVANNMFGYSVALNPAGNRIVIGEQEYDVSGDNDEGAFNLFNIDGALIEQRLADTPLVDDFLGYAASITANYIAVVATEHDGAGTDQGAVYMFGYGGPSISSIEKPIDYFIWETEARRIDQFRIKKERRHE